MNTASLLQLFRLRKTLIAMKNNTNPEVDIKLSDGMVDNFIKLEDLHIPTHFPDSDEIINKFFVNRFSLSIFFNLSEIFEKNKLSFFSSLSKSHPYLLSNLIIDLATYSINGIVAL